MPTMPTETLTVTIDAPVEVVTTDLADPAAQPEWATEFFSSPAVQGADDVWTVNVPMMGGEVTMKIDADIACGRIDMYLAPAGAPFGPPLPVRVIPNGDGCDVLFTLARFPGQPDDQWTEGLASMQRELLKLKNRHEG